MRRRWLAGRESLVRVMLILLLLTTMNSSSRTSSNLLFATSNMQSPHSVQRLRSRWSTYETPLQDPSARNAQRSRSSSDRRECGEGACEGGGWWPHERMAPCPPSELFCAPPHSSAGPLPQPDTLCTGSAPASDALPPLWTAPRYLLASIIASPASEALAPVAAPRLHDDGQKVNYNMILECIPDSERSRRNVRITSDKYQYIHVSNVR